MDFNTGAGGTGNSGGSSGGPGGSPRGAQSAAAAEFRYTDPVQTFIATVQAVVLRPVEFFRGILRQGDLINPLIFALICYEISAILGGIVGLAFGIQGFGGFISSIILTPIFAAIILFVGAGIAYLLVMLIVGSRNAGFEGTLRVWAYASVIQLVSWLSAIPIIGILISIAIGVYGVFLGVVGIREVHTTTTGKAALVVLIPVAVILSFLLLVGGAALFFLSQQR